MEYELNELQNMLYLLIVLLDQMNKIYLILCQIALIQHQILLLLEVQQLKLLKCELFLVFLFVVLFEHDELHFQI